MIDWSSEAELGVDMTSWWHRGFRRVDSCFTLQACFKRTWRDQKGSSIGHRDFHERRDNPLSWIPDGILRSDIQTELYDLSNTFHTNHLVLSYTAWLWVKSSSQTNRNAVGKTVCPATKGGKTAIVVEHITANVSVGIPIPNSNDLLYVE